MHLLIEGNEAIPRTTITYNAIGKACIIENSFLSCILKIRNTKAIKLYELLTSKTMNFGDENNGKARKIIIPTISKPEREKLIVLIYSENILTC